MSLQSLSTVAVMGLFGFAASAQSSPSTSASADSKAQTTQSQTTSAPEPVPPKDSNTATGTTPDQPKSLADLARKAKENQKNGQNAASKPRVYSDDDFAATSAKGSQDKKADMPNFPAASGSKPANVQPGGLPAGTRIDILKFELQKPTFKRPGGSPVDWQIQNKSDNPANLRVTVALVVTGPCNYKDEQSNSIELNQGTGYADNMFGVAFYESQCAGQYSLELRISSGGQLLKSASITANVL